MENNISVGLGHYGIQLSFGGWHIDRPPQLDGLDHETAGGDHSLVQWSGLDRADQPTRAVGSRNAGNIRGKISIVGNSFMKVRDLISLVEADGWYQMRTRGSHRQYKHPVKKGRVTIPGHPRDDIHPKTLRSVLAQAGLKGGS